MSVIVIKDVCKTYTMAGGMSQSVLTRQFKG